MSELPPSPFAPPRTENLFADGSAGEVSPGALEALRKTRPWLMFFAILSFLGTALALLAGVAMFFMGALPEAATAGNPIGRFGWVLGIVYFVVGAAYIYPGVRLLQCALAIGRLLNGAAARDLELVLTLQMRVWRYGGIFTIAMIVLYFVFIAVMVGMAARGSLPS